jgi:uncharacterized protein
VKPHHRINYIEFACGKLEQVKAFYAAVFGWTFTDYGPDYTAFSDGALDGGFARGTGDETPRAISPLVVLYSSNLESTFEAVQRAGGKIVIPTFPFPGGRRFHFADPAGNVLGVWSE